MAGREVIGLRLNFSKRYITLAPIATVIGLAFRMFDPDKLWVRKRSRYHVRTDSARTAGITIGRRHFPVNVPFQNGPILGKDVFVPLDAIIGGPKMAGSGWRMLVEQLSVGRCISLPSNGTGGAKAGTWATGAYARIRKQFNTPVGKFEGVEAVIARMVGPHLHDGRRALGDRGRDRRWREAFRSFGDAEVPCHRDGSPGGERCDGCARWKGHLSRT